MKAALKQIGLGLAFVAIVVLLTATFSLLGAISCAVVSGMILGAARQWRRLGILLSFFFPAITLFLAQVFNALPVRQSLLFSLVCFAGYWVSYLLTFGLMLMERKAEPQPAPHTASQASPERNAGARAPSELAGESAANAAAPASWPAAFIAGPNLEQLTGEWLCETMGRDHQAHRKIIEIADGRLVWNDINSAGQRRLLAQGMVKLERLGPFNVIRILTAEAQPREAASQSSQPAPAWIFRLADQALSIATNFESEAPELEPAAEIYHRVAGSVIVS